MDTLFLDTPNVIIRDYLVRHPDQVEAIWNGATPKLIRLQTEMNSIEPNSFTEFLAEDSVLLNIIVILGILSSLAAQYRWYRNADLSGSIETSITSARMQKSLYDPVREVLEPVLDNYHNDDAEFLYFVQNFEMGNDEWFDSVGSYLLYGEPVPLMMIETLSNLGTI